MSTYSEHDQRVLDQSGGRALDRLASAPAILVGSVPRARPRPDFTTPPRPEPRGAMLRSATDSLGAMVACFRRQGNCPQIVTRHDWRTWRWLCMPMGRPLSGDGA